MKEIPNDTWIKIVKPTIPIDEWKHEWLEVAWNNRMNDFDNCCFRIESFNGSTYRLSGISYNWHRDWLILADLDKNGNPIPDNNDQRLKCYWCNRKTKTKFIKYEKGDIKYTYCPDCLR
jgi:hypothetical protein